MVESKLRRISLFSIFFTFCLDNLGATIVFPIFAPLFLNSEHGILPVGIPMGIRTILLGFFLGAFPFSQFLFSPFVGEFADRYGRKIGLIITTFLALLGYFLSAISISHHRLALLFLGRLILGLSAANLAICLAAISDLSPTPKKKISYFSYGSALAGLTFVLGPFIGGKLSDSTINSHFNPAFPMWVGSFLAVINLIFILFAFRETHHDRKILPFDFIQGIQNIHRAFRMRRVRDLYAIYFLFLFAFNMIFQFIPAFLVQDFELSFSRIGDITALMGGCWVIGTGVFYKLFERFFSHKTLLIGALIFFACLCIYLPFAKSMVLLVTLLGIIIALAGVIWPICTGGISNTAEKEYQGKILGVSQSMQSLTMMLAPFIGGPFLQVHVGIPFYISAVSILVALWFAFTTKHPV